MQKYKVQLKKDVVTENTTFNDSIYSGWRAINTGNTTASVMGITLAPGEMLDFYDLSPEAVWGTPIQILPNSGEVTLMRLQYFEQK